MTTESGPAGCGIPRDLVHRKRETLWTPQSLAHPTIPHFPPCCYQEKLITHWTYDGTPVGQAYKDAPDAAP
jgi:hypothetical protein